MSATITRRAPRPAKAAAPDDAPGVTFAAAPPPTGTVELRCTISALLHERLQDSARAAKQSLGSFVPTLLGTDYHAKARPAGDRDFDTAVARAVILSRTHNSAEIAEATGLSEATVLRVIEAWRAEMARGGAA